MTKRSLLPPMLIMAATGLAACGSSTAPGVQLAPSKGATAPTLTSAPTTPTTPTPTTSATTPAPPSPLSKKPAVVVPKGAAPHVLVIKDLIVGTGPAATPGKTITVNYVGALFNNSSEFDSSWKRNQPFTTTLSSGNVIDGWVKGIAGMKVGGRRMLIIPPSLGYGKAGAGSTIPPNSTLVFVVDLLGVS